MTVPAGGRLYIEHGNHRESRPRRRRARLVRGREQPARLNVEAESFDALIEQVRCAIQDLLEARGGSGQIDMPVELTAHAQVQIGTRA